MCLVQCSVSLMIDVLCVFCVFKVCQMFGGFGMGSGRPEVSGGSEGGENG